MNGPWYFSQSLPGEICAHRTVLSVLFFHLYQGAPEANTSKLTRASRSRTEILVFTNILYRKSRTRPERGNSPMSFYLQLTTVLRADYCGFLPMPPDFGDQSDRDSHHAKQHDSQVAIQFGDLRLDLSQMLTRFFVHQHPVPRDESNLPDVRTGHRSYSRSESTAQLHSRLAL